jgi:endoglucanase Acf2
VISVGKVALVVIGVSVLAGACGPSQQSLRAIPPPPTVPNSAVGKGFYVTQPPDGILVGGNHDHKKIKPKVTPDFQGPPATNDWWSSLIWQYENSEPYSYELFPHPLTLRASAKGLFMGYSDKPTIAPREYMFPYEKDLIVGVDGLSAPETRVAGYSDWSVTAEWSSGQKKLRSTFGHGMPFVYFEKSGGDAVVRVANDKAPNATVFADNGSALGVTVGGHHYGLFAPTKATWSHEGGTFQSSLDGKDYFSVAILPDNKPETLELFRTHAYAFVKETRVSWSYDEKTAKLTTQYTLSTELKDATKGLASTPLSALYRHQWLHTNSALLPIEYASPRGTMKVVEGNTFTTTMPFTGVLPTMPVVESADKGRLKTYVRQVAWKDDLFPPGLGAHPDRDTYWIGKSMGKISSALQIADQIGDIDDRDFLVRALENELQDWFDGRAPKLFYYDKTWATLVGVPASYESDAALNDHHFHYGYFLQAAAAVARYDAAWAKTWAPYFNLLMADAANVNRADKRFPFLRYMDVYAGHSWANGPSQYHQGNNEESSSEEMNFSTALILWGSVIGDKTVRDAGIYLFTTQAAAIEQYWFDVDHAVFPKDFKPPVLGMVWGAGGKYDTWFDNNPVLVHGINYLPFQGGSLYLGRRPDAVKRGFDAIMAQSQGQVYTWRDYALMYLALTDGPKAAAMLEEDTYLEPEYGNSRAMTYNWINTLAKLGRVDTTVTADVPTYAVFAVKGQKSYVAFNPDGAARKVTFSDGFVMQVPARAMKVGGRGAQTAE